MDTDERLGYSSLLTLKQGTVKPEFKGQPRDRRLLSFQGRCPLNSEKMLSEILLSEEHIYNGIEETNEGYYCRVCDINFDCINHVEPHIKGSKHISKQKSSSLTRKEVSFKHPRREQTSPPTFLKRKSSSPTRKVSFKHTFKREHASSPTFSKPTMKEVSFRQPSREHTSLPFFSKPKSSSPTRKEVSFKQPSREHTSLPSFLKPKSSSPTRKEISFQYRRREHTSPSSFLKPKSSSPTRKEVSFKYRRREHTSPSSFLKPKSSSPTRKEVSFKYRRREHTSPSSFSKPKSSSPSRKEVSLKHPRRKHTSPPFHLKPKSTSPSREEVSLKHPRRKHTSPPFHLQKKSRAHHDAPPRKPSHLEKMLMPTDLAIGLDFIMEYYVNPSTSEEKPKWFYSCTLCHYKCKQKDIVKHCTGFDHHRSLIKKRNSKEYYKLVYKNTTFDTFAPQLEKWALRHHRRYGHGRPICMPLPSLVSHKSQLDIQPIPIEPKVQKDPIIRKTPKKTYLPKPRKLPSPVMTPLPDPDLLVKFFRSTGLSDQQILDIIQQEKEYFELHNAESQDFAIPGNMVKKKDKGL